MEEGTSNLLNYLLAGGSTSLTKSNSSEVLQLFPKLRNLGILSFSGKSSYHLDMENRKLLKKLLELNSFEEYLNWLNQKDVNADINLTSMEMSNERKIFISHSSLDIEIVEKVIDILEAIGVPDDKIFCSSFEGYGAKLGSDFLEVLKKELDSNVLVLFILSSNFYSSVVSLCEMGATWVKTNNHIPILIPPFAYDDIKGVIPTTHGMKINEKDKLNSLKDIVVDFIGIEPLNTSVWERRRNNVLKEIKRILDTGIPETKEKSELHERSELVLDSYYGNQNEKIKSLSKTEWPKDFEMQLDYIQRQKRAIEKLKDHNPIDISKEEFKSLRHNGRVEWPDDFEMQLDFEQRQVESLRRLNEI